MSLKRINRQAVCIRIFFALLLFVVLKNPLKAEFIFGISSGYAFEQYNKSLTAPFGHYIIKENETLYCGNRLNDNTHYFINLLTIAPPNLDPKHLVNKITKEKIFEKISKQRLDENTILLSNLWNTIEFSTTIHSIPFDINVQYEFGRKFRIGFGGTLELSFFKDFDISISKTYQRDYFDNFTAFFKKNFIPKANTKHIRASTMNLKLQGIAPFFKNLDHAELDKILYIVNRIKTSSTKQEKNKSRLIEEIKKAKGNDVRNNSPEFKKYVPKSNYIVSLSPYVIIGFKLFETDSIAGIIEVQWSPYIVRLSLNSFQEIETHIIKNTLLGFPTIGASIEQHISEYFKLFYKFSVRPMETYEDKISDFKFPIKYTNSWRFSFEFGTRFTIPETQKCIIYQCAIKTKHRHNNIKMRGCNMFIGKDQHGKKMFTKAISY